jgi:ABC-type branched-subunit amino acid transport system substrate-binding protein
VEELAAVAGVTFVGPIIRPHVQTMRKNGGLSDEAQEILRYVEKAAEELIKLGTIKHQTLEAIRRPLVSQEVFFENWNKGKW